MDAFITRVKNTAHDANVPCCPQKGWVKETFAEHKKVWGYPGGYESSKDFGASDKYQSGTTEGVIKNAEKSSEGRETIPTIPTK